MLNAPTVSVPVHVLRTKLDSKNLDGLHCKINYRHFIPPLGQR